MVSRSLVLGYHGCDQSTAVKVNNGDRQIPSTNGYDWLGNGLYFWEDSYSRAWKWAQADARDPKGKVKVPAVLGAIIDLGNCLNLIDAESLELVKAAHSAYRDLCRVSRLQPAQNQGMELRARYLDKAVFAAAYDQAAAHLQDLRDAYQQAASVQRGGTVPAQEVIQGECALLTWLECARTAEAVQGESGDKDVGSTLVIRLVSFRLSGGRSASLRATQSDAHHISVTPGAGV